MSDYQASRIEKTEHFRIGPLRQRRGKRRPYVIGFDSEADASKPMLLQFSMPDETEDEVRLLVVSDEPYAGWRIWSRFLWDSFSAGRDVRNREILIYAFNLEYEFTQLFHDFPDEVLLASDYSLTSIIEHDGRQIGEIEARIANGKRQMATFVIHPSKTRIRLLDARSFFKTSLGGAAKMLGVGTKYESDTIDRSKFSRADLDNPEFLMYARRDAYITRLIGERIVAMHEEYDVPTCISAPHFASKVFRTQFLTRDVERPTEPLEQLGLHSYHGGKNGFYLHGPTRIDNAYDYDITSAYPEAMRALPDIELGEWRATERYAFGTHSLWYASIAYRRCPYRGAMQYNGRWPETGYIANLPITGYELDAMVERDECTITSASGWVFDGPSGGPLTAYVDRFFALKARSVGPEREIAKLFLNSLYGKFFQKVALGQVGEYDLEADRWITTNADGDFDWRAGGLYHPPIASLITGYVRARIHRMEHKYQALMTSTDGIFGLAPPDSADIGKHLGGLTVKTGRLDIWRERLYIFTPHDWTPENDVQEKYALHGFRGPVDLLRTIPLASGTWEYPARLMVTLKLSTHKVHGVRYAPGTFIEAPFVLTL